jgi:hypothetical protein
MKYKKNGKPLNPKSPFEELLISCYKDRMIAYMHAHPEAYDEAAKLAVTDKQPYAWRSAWLLWSCITPDDARIKKHLNKFIRYIPIAQQNQKRELLKIALSMKLSERQESRLFDVSIDLWKDISKDPSIRMMAFRMLLKIMEKYPELKGEILLLADEHYIKTLSPGIQHSIRRLLGQIKAD